MATRLLPPGYQELTSSGAIASGAKLYTYTAGTSTPKASYSDEALTVPNSNPVVADGSGRFGDIFATTGQYRLVMKTSADVTLWTADPVDGAFTLGAVMTEDLAIQKADPQLTLDATSGVARIEVKGAIGQYAYIDLQIPGTDDYDLRLLSTGTGGSIYSSSDLFVIPASGMTVVNLGDVRTYRQTATTTGAVQFGSAGTSTLTFDGTAFAFNADVSDGKGKLRGIPQNTQTGAYVLASTDVGKCVNITTGGVTVNTGVFSSGDVVYVYNNSGASQTITEGASTSLLLGGTATTGSRTLAQRGVARILCVAANTFVVDGSGVT